MTCIVRHPTFPEVFEEVSEGSVATWIAAGWVIDGPLDKPKKSRPKSMTQTKKEQTNEQSD